MRLRWMPVAAAALALLAAAPAQAEPPPCGPEHTDRLTLSTAGFVATRSDGFFTPVVRETASGRDFPADGIDERSFAYSVPAPARVEVTQEDGVPNPRLDAPEPGPLTLTASWDKYPATVSVPSCRATGSVDLSVLPARVPATRREPVGAPLEFGPLVSWPCPDLPRVIDTPATVLVRYERGLAKAPSAGSPSATLALPAACQSNLVEGRLGVIGRKRVPGVLTFAVGGWFQEPTRTLLELQPERAADLRVRVEIRWGTVLAFSHDYAIVSAGSRQIDRRRSPVFLFTEPGAAATAAARRYAPQRRGRPYVGPGQRTAALQRQYRFTISGSWRTSWTAALGAPGERGCGFVRESGADSATFSGQSVLRGRIERSYRETRECEPVRPPRKADTCPSPSRLGGDAFATVVPDGGLLSDLRRARGTRLALDLRPVVRDGDCPGWGGLQPAMVLDAAAGAVPRLRRGRSTRVRLARTVDCRESVVGAAGEPVACTARLSASVVVQRVR